MATFTVTNSNNSGAGSLRQAVLDANAQTGKDIINFGGLFNDGLAHTISLTHSGLRITDDLIIQGTNPSLLTIKDDSADRIFDIGKGVTSAINGLTITNTYDGAGGGGAISNLGVLTVNYSIITGNSAGGGIYNTGSLTVNHSIISNNTGSGSGGGITSSSYDNNANTITTINYSTIAGNTANIGLGGGIYNTGGSLTVNHSTITDNTADASDTDNGNFYGSGGGIYNTESLTVNYSIISNNTAKNGGGIEGSYDSNTIVNHSIIGGNTARSGGGGIYIDILEGRQTLSVSNSSISDNTASGSGGGIGVGDYGNISGITITVSNSIISGNSALKGDGGGIYDGANGDGRYDTTGAIIIIPGLTPNTLNITNSIISNNSAGADGGGIYNHSELQYEIYNFTSSTINVTNSIISGNSAGADGGGISNLGIITVTNSTISSNTALKGGGGIYNGGFTYPGYKSPDYIAYGNLTVIKSIISDNSASTGGGIYNYGTLSVSYSSIGKNYATDYGGGIYNSSFNEFSLSNADSNVVVSRYNTFGIVNVSHSSINGNSAGTAGGGIYNDADQDFGKTVLIIEGTNAYANITSDGLGIVKVSDSTINDNQAHLGGGIYNNATLTVDNSIIKHNKAFRIKLSSGQQESGKGGGIYNSDSSYATATIDYSSIACNFDTPEEDSNKFIKIDNLVGKFITKGSVVRA